MRPRVGGLWESRGRRDCAFPPASPSRGAGGRRLWNLPSWSAPVTPWGPARLGTEVLGIVAVSPSSRALRLPRDTQKALGLCPIGLQFCRRSCGGHRAFGCHEEGGCKGAGLRTLASKTPTWGLSPCRAEVGPQGLLIGHTMPAFLLLFFFLVVVAVGKTKFKTIILCSWWLTGPGQAGSEPRSRGLAHGPAWGFTGGRVGRAGRASSRQRCPRGPSPSACQPHAASVCVRCRTQRAAGPEG